MKKILFAILAVTMIACSSNDEYTIKIELKDFANKQINLIQRIDREMVTIDSVTLDAEGTGEMTGSISSEEMMYITQSESGIRMSIFMGNYDYTISGAIDDIKIEASTGPQSDYNTYLEETTKFQDEMKAIGQKFGEAMQAKVPEDSLDKIREAYYEIATKKDSYDSVYISENTSSAVSLYLLRNTFYTLDDKQLESKLSAFDEALHSSTYYVFLDEHLQKMKNVAVGMKFVDFEQPDSLGNPVKLSDFAGKGVLLIDFWASWCGPCRAANPGVVELYNEFHEKGFDILGVSLDREKQDWLKAIKDDGLVWNHVSDVKFWDCEAAQLYAVSSIPSTVLLDADGIIVAKNLHKDELREKLIELLGE